MPVVHRMSGLGHDDGDGDDAGAGDSYTADDLDTEGPSDHVQGTEIVLPLASLTACTCPEAPIHMRSTSVSAVAPMPRSDGGATGGGPGATSPEVGVGPGTMGRMRGFLGSMLGAGRDPDDRPLVGEGPGGGTAGGVASRQ